MDVNERENNAYQPEHETRQERRRANSNGWIGGLVLIALGLIFLLQNLTNFHINNWWALFILIPAFGAFGQAWTSYQNEGGRVTEHVRNRSFVGVLLTLIAAIFLLDLNWSLLGPILLLVLGAGILLGAFTRSE